MADEYPTSGHDEPGIVHLRGFIAVIDTGSHAEAAQRLGIHVKSMGRYIRLVQQYFGEGLFEGGKDYGKLTERGRIADKAAREAIAVLEKERERIKVECPVLRVGFVRMMRPLVERAVRTRVTTQTSKTVEFRLFELTSEQQARALAARELDVAICFRLPLLSDAKDFDEFEVSTHPYALAVPAHAWMNGELAVDVLRRLHYAHPPSRLSPDVIDAGEEWLASEQVNPTTKLECDFATQIIAYAGSGIGFGFVPALWSAASREGVVFVPLPTFATSAKISLYTLGHATTHAKGLRKDLQASAREALEGF